MTNLPVTLPKILSAAVIYGQKSEKSTVYPAQKFCKIQKIRRQNPYIYTANLLKIGKMYYFHVLYEKFGQI